MCLYCGGACGIYGRIAQSVERSANNAVVLGLSPSMTITLLFVPPLSTSNKHKETLHFATTANHQTTLNTQNTHAYWTHTHADGCTTPNTRTDTHNNRLHSNYTRHTNNNTQYPPYSTRHRSLSTSTTRTTVASRCVWIPRVNTRPLSVITESLPSSSFATRSTPPASHAEGV